MGAPVVHGVHVLLWALEQWTRHPVHLVSVRAAFRKPVYLDRDVTLDIVQESAERVRLVVRVVEGVALEASVSARAGGVAESTIAQTAWLERSDPCELTPAAIAGARGELALALDDARARETFPQNLANLGRTQLAELLAVTRLVGMVCPGQHSLLGGIDLDEKASDAPALAYEVTSFTPKYSRLSIAINGPTWTGRVEAFHRPPSAPVTMDDVVRAVPGAIAQGQRALVIGGSRGIGETFAKAIAAGGGDVCLTYRSGGDDAARVVSDIRSSGFRATAMHYDVLSPPDLRASWPLSGPPTHLYYLATPTLFSIRKGTLFDPAELDLLLRYYVFGLHAAVAACNAAGSERLIVWTPSTTMLDAISGGTAYCVAKAAMEELCRRLPEMFRVTVHAPRLGRIDTDQTAGLIVLPPAPALPIVIEQLQRVAG
jgi:hypothetical protein